MSEYPTQNIELCAKDEEIARLKELCKRAAQSLEDESWPSEYHDYREIIAELRSAAK